MSSEFSVNPRTLNADEASEVERRPSWIFLSALHARLVTRHRNDVIVVRRHRHVVQGGVHDVIGGVVERRVFAVGVLHKRFAQLGFTAKQKKYRASLI